LALFINQSESVNLFKKQTNKHFTLETGMLCSKHILVVFNWGYV